MSKMLINARHPEEIRVATIKNNKGNYELIGLDIEYKNIEQKKSNIYNAKISRIEPSLEAVFVSYGSDKQGFLPFKDINPSYFKKAIPENSNEKPNIKELLDEGQELLIQIDKEERGSKGAAVTTYISLAGCYLVLMPNNPDAGGISKRIEGEAREELKQVMDSLVFPTEMGIIIRTAGVNKDIEDLQWDLDILLHQWKAITEASVNHRAPCLIYQENNLIIRAIRDNLRKDITDIVVDDNSTWEQATEFMKSLNPESANLVKLYDKKTPLFSYYKIESQIEAAFSREVKLPSGGSLVFDSTEALTAIDINSAQATKGVDIEATALQTNIEAAQEIPKQLRIRDIAGLIVIDFIDMLSTSNQKEVENQLKKSIKQDKARVQVGKISNFGLLEMSRQRIRPALVESSQILCTKCEGHGFIRSIESLSLAILRIIEEKIAASNISRLQIQAAVDICAYLSNEKRADIIELEKIYDKRILLIPNPNFEYPRYEITVSYSNAPKAQDSDKKSYELIKSVEASYSPSISNKQQEAPIITNTILARPEQAPRKRDSGLLSKIWSYFKTTEQHASKSGRNTSKSHFTSERDGNRDRVRDDRDDRYNKNKRGQQGKSTRHGDPQSRKRQHPKKNQRRPLNRTNTNINEKVLENQNIQKQEQHISKPSKEFENNVIIQQDTNDNIQPIEQPKKAEVINKDKTNKVDATNSTNAETKKKFSKPKKKRVRKSLSGDMEPLEIKENKGTKGIKETKKHSAKEDLNQGNDVQFIVETETTSELHDLPDDNIGNLKSQADANKNSSDIDNDDNKFKKKHFSKNKKHQKKNFYKNKNAKPRSAQKPKTKVTD